ncbi:RES family NAD+ phosphorylase [Novosphingobium flavum]|uniref:RES family NAD+ phosphorylase n=1 Tax=Novosphingobium aerophilum TaxID=2839843 RepID=A0A7X1KD07_9SPHN|nr:RES family NAD+ phosphorylase [Novosphingobium aerophilum]MBC2652806.1 RES family NAD+ phosphorylase [Novosphingobium aerophilum]MBC2662498.1 RES family NAD+ phosphorylase [Novosphingobium aerophilum]
MSSAPILPVSRVEWRGAVRIIRSAYPPIDLYEDIADPADWPLLISAEQKTNPRLMATIGNLDLVPAERRVGGAGASFLMAPFTHVSADRPSRFTDGSYGVLYVGISFETALFETIHHHARFMLRTREAPGWTSQFREIVLSVSADLHDLRGQADAAAALEPDNYSAAQALAGTLRAAGSNGIVYPSVRHAGGECAALFYPDGAASPVQGRHLDYHWDGQRVDLVRDAGSGAVFRVVDLPAAES